MDHKPLPLNLGTPTPVLVPREGAEKLLTEPRISAVKNALHQSFGHSRSEPAAKEASHSVATDPLKGPAQQRIAQSSSKVSASLTASRETPHSAGENTIRACTKATPRDTDRDSRRGSLESPSQSSTGKMPASHKDSIRLSPYANIMSLVTPRMK